MYFATVTYIRCHQSFQALIAKSIFSFTTTHSPLQPSCAFQLISWQLSFLSLLLSPGKKVSVDHPETHSNESSVTFIISEVGTSTNIWAS